MCLSPQLSHEHVHHCVGERKLHYLSSVRADILLHQPGRGLPALPGPHLFTGRLWLLCACKYTLIRRWIMEIPCRKIQLSFPSRIVRVEHLDLQKQLDQISVQVDRWTDSFNVSCEAEKHTCVTYILTYKVNFCYCAWSIFYYFIRGN